MSDDVSPSLAGRGAIDVSECALEPIRTPGATQPRGALLAVDEQDGRVTHASANLADYLGVAPRQVLGAPFDSIGAQELHAAAAAVSAEGSAGRPQRLALQTPAGRRTVDVFAHRREGRLIVELEDVEPGEAAASFGGFQDEVRLTLQHLQRATDVQSLLDLAVAVTRQLTGFDRVLAYRFQPDEHGVVVSESREERLEPFLGLHFPASDIPSQARALYREQWLRAIPDSHAEAVDLVAAARADPPAGLDLSGAVLRAVSPVHLEYLRNMGVRASLSVSLIVDRRLWGLIACHHYGGPRLVPYRARAACEVVGLTTSLTLESRERLDRAQHGLGIERTVSALLGRVAGSRSIAEGLAGDEDLLLRVCGATGAAIQVEGELRTVGRTPAGPAMERLVAAVRENLRPGVVYESDSLAVEHPDLADISQDAAGVLAISLSRARGNVALWLRPDRVDSVTWAGNPAKAVELDENGSQRLGPRRSFAAWTQSVGGRCEPWGRFEIEAVSTLASALGAFVLDRAERLASLNAELARSNAELDAFAAAASAKLDEPVRSIHEFADSLIEDYVDLLDEQGLARARTILRLSERLGSLLDSLLKYSRVGRAQLERRALPFRSLVDEAAVLVATKLAPAEMTVSGAGELFGDRAQILELLANLLSNAASYTESAAPRIDVRLRPASELGEQPHGLPEQAAGAASVVSVCDDGIGIPQQHAEEVFEVFRRLHPRDAYGGGTGTGLTIARRIVERHHGAIWIESPPGGGTCVHFVLGAD
jgi:light-regulated signal transduction histidine kinase (bacteriophytochrome)